MKLSLPDVTICMHLRIDSEIRLRNVMTILKYITAMANVRVIVMEGDAAQRGQALSAVENISYVFVQDNDPVFQLAAYRNQLIRMAETPVVVLWDVDVVAPPEQLREAIEKVRRKEAVLAWPYDGICYNVPREVAVLFETAGDISALTTRTHEFTTMCGASSTGGIFVADRDRYMTIGMDNENLHGWGPEDTERLKRTTILGLPVYRVRGDLFHLWHPRGVNSRHIDPQTETAACKEFLKICRCTKTELTAYVATWSWTKNC